MCWKLQAALRWWERLKTGDEAVRIVQGLAPQVIVMDVIMPNKDGIDACREIMEILPGTRVLMLTASSEMDAVIDAVAAGATGYLQKYSQPEELVEAVLDVAEGRLSLPDQVVKEVFALFRRDREDTSNRVSDRLTALERETLTLFTSGRSYAEIAEARGNSTVTVRKHPLPHTGKTGGQEQAGTRDLGCAQRPAGRRGGGP